VVRRLELKGKTFKTFDSLSPHEIQEFWDELNIIEPLSTTIKRKKDIVDKTNLHSFYNHCCRARTYFFSIKKCGQDDCTIIMQTSLDVKRKVCTGPRIDSDQHYYKFEGALQRTQQKKTGLLYKLNPKKKSLPFTPSQ